MDRFGRARGLALHPTVRRPPDTWRAASRLILGWTIVTRVWLGRILVGIFANVVQRPSHLDLADQLLGSSVVALGSLEVARHPVTGDPDDPRDHVGTALERAGVADHPDERLLGQLLGDAMRRGSHAT